MLDPLQNILDCMALFYSARKSQAEKEGDPLYHMVGEMDAITEIHRQLEELGIKWKK